MAPNIGTNPRQDLSQFDSHAVLSKHKQVVWSGLKPGDVHIWHQGQLKHKPLGP